MLHRVTQSLFLLLVVAAAAASAQMLQKGPVTLAELRGILTRAERSEALIGPTNRDLIAAIEEPGVDFVLTPEEEWALQLREASDELIAALRSAVDPAERETRLRANRQQSLYNAFVRNLNSSDLTSKTTALNAGRDFIGEFADDPNVAQIVAYIRRQLPMLERTVAALRTREEMMERNRARDLYRQTMRENNAARRAAPAQTNTNAAPPPVSGTPPPPQQQQPAKKPD